MIFGLDQSCPIDIQMTGMEVDTLTEQILIVGRAPPSPPSPPNSCNVLNAGNSVASAFLTLYDNKGMK